MACATGGTGESNNDYGCKWAAWVGLVFPKVAIEVGCTEIRRVLSGFSGFSGFSNGLIFFNFSVWKLTGFDSVMTFLQRIRCRIDTAIERTEKTIELGLLGAGKPGDYRRPEFVKTDLMPAGMAGYMPKNGVAEVNRTSPGHPLAGSGKKTKYGQILESTTRPDRSLTRAAGYGSEKTLAKVMRRHEIKHSITAAARGYEGHQRIRDLVKDEVGAYSRMNRRVKGGSRLLRGINGVLGVGASTAIGVATSPLLKQRVKRRIKQAAIGAGGLGVGVVAANSMKKPTAGS